jgi:hypothetical protein
LLCCCCCCSWGGHIAQNTALLSNFTMLSAYCTIEFFFRPNAGILMQILQGHGLPILKWYGTSSCNL